MQKEQMINRFERYVKVHTTSDPQSTTVPSTKIQKDLAVILVQELKEFGISVDYDSERGYVYAKIPSNLDKNVPVVGFLAHMDTAPDLTGEFVNPQVISNYDGEVIKLNHEHSLDPEVFPELKNYTGKTLITTDGTTLLGADDKAGITEIMEAIRYIVEHPEFKHGEIAIGFTVDEEIGRGADYFDVKRFGADFAYTMDGGDPGEIAYSNFNAASVKIELFGRNVHPGTAKNQMIHAGELAAEFIKLFPKYEKPQYTEGEEGFYHLTSLTGTVDRAEICYIIRDHSKVLFEQKKNYVQKSFDEFLSEHGINGTIKIEDSYYNMLEIVKDHKYIIDIAINAIEKSGLTPVVAPIRGGTDGSRLSFMGLPCPNIFTGGHNYHGRHEYVCVESMMLATQTILNIINNVTKVSIVKK
ncbi:MAG: peptidase T [Mycoplasmatales bacterium]